MWKKLLFIIICSQFFILGAFWLSEDSYYVVQEEKNLCWVFTKGNAQEPNWLPNGWEAVFLDETKELQFFSTLECQNDSIANCCKKNAYRYAGVPIGTRYVSDERAGAEFLASKGYINVKSFNPDKYNLEATITRKEVMKLISGLWNLELSESCQGIFADVADDWGCKHIEAALLSEYISSNQGFRPNDTLTRSEALKLIFKARGIQKRYETNNWQEDYISSAYYLGYIDQKFSQYNESATRGWFFSVAAKTFKEFSND